MTHGPLAGIKVIEIEGLGPAPCTGMMLADMGAEVILVGRKQANANAAPGEAAAKQLFFNRGKKSIAVDLKKGEGIELVLKLVKNADVLIEGFRPGVMERLGLGPEICAERNPQLVYGRMTGWGQTGPLSRAAGHDSNYIGISGAMWYGGSIDREPGAPLTLVGDMGGGAMMLAWGVLCAVLEAQRTGKGQVVDAAITDGSAYISSLLLMLKNTGQLQNRLGCGWADGGAPWNATYECADGKFVNICSLEPRFYGELIQRLGLEDDSLFANQWNTESWPQARQVLAQVFRQKSREQWCRELEGTDVCFAPVLNFDEAARHPHNVARDVFQNPGGVLQPSPAPKLSGYSPKISAPPGIGEHCDEILGGLGYGADEIALLKARGAI